MVSKQSVLLVQMDASFRASKSCVEMLITMSSVSSPTIVLVLKGNLTRGVLRMSISSTVLTVKEGVLRTNSEKRSVSLPVFRSRSKFTKLGGEVSAMTRSALVTMGTKGVPEVSAMTSEVKLTKVSAGPEPRLDASLI